MQITNIILYAYMLFTCACIVLIIHLVIGIFSNFLLKFHKKRDSYMPSLSTLLLLPLFLCSMFQSQDKCYLPWITDYYHKSQPDLNKVSTILFYHTICHDFLDTLSLILLLLHSQHDTGIL